MTFQRQRAEVRAQSLPRPQGSLFEGFTAADATADAERHQFRSTRYDTIAPLLDVLPLPGGLWIEPCAGDGALIRHVERWRRENGAIQVTAWIAVDIRESSPLREYCTTLGRRCAVFDGCDFTAWEPPDRRDRIGASVVITNLPWYGWEPIVDRAFELFPNAHVVGLSCMRELQNDGGRADWHLEHPADLYVCHGRQRFSAETAGYPHPVAWFHWPPGQRDRTDGARWRMLPRTGDD